MKEMESKVFGETKYCKIKNHIKPSEISRVKTNKESCG